MPRQTSEVYATSEQDRQLAACSLLMEKPSQQDIRTDRKFCGDNDRDGYSIAANFSHLFVTSPVEHQAVYDWLRSNGFRPVSDGVKIVF